MRSDCIKTAKRAVCCSLTVTPPMKRKSKCFITFVCGSGMRMGCKLAYQYLLSSGSIVKISIPLTNFFAHYIFFSSVNFEGVQCFR